MIPISNSIRSVSPQSPLHITRALTSVALLLVVASPVFSQALGTGLASEPAAGKYVLAQTVQSRPASGSPFNHEPQQPPQSTREWRENHDNFSPPESTTAFAQGTRKVNTHIWPSSSVSPMRYKRVLSNPYIPIDRIDLPNLNWVISPYYAQGFFESISSFSCRPDGTLYVAGKVGVAADTLRGKAWARGIWRIEPDGKILAHEVVPDSSQMRNARQSCNVRTCGLPANAARDRALADGSDDWAEDKHGNVWGIRSNLKIT